MSDSGRMARRLASSYREDDLRRTDQWRRSQATPDAAQKLAVEPTLRFKVATILRLIPWRA